MTKVTRNTTDTNGIAQEFTFGVEIETTCPRSNRLRIGSYYSTGEQVPYLPEGWVAKSDGSIRTDKAGHVDVEIVSPILRGEAGIAQLIEVIRMRVNPAGLRSSILDNCMKKNGLINRWLLP